MRLGRKSCAVQFCHFTFRLLLLPLVRAIIIVFKHQFGARLFRHNLCVLSLFFEDAFGRMRKLYPPHLTRLGDAFNLGRNISCKHELIRTLPLSNIIILGSEFPFHVKREREQIRFRNELYTAFGFSSGSAQCAFGEVTQRQQYGKLPVRTLEKVFKKMRKSCCFCCLYLQRQSQLKGGERKTSSLGC
jgi:hypothetical protein